MGMRERSYKYPENREYRAFLHRAAAVRIMGMKQH
jgi:hypothetical protein